jgi:hypothetical protein
MCVECKALAPKLHPVHNMRRHVAAAPHQAVQLTTSNKALRSGMALALKFKHPDHQGADMEPQTQPQSASALPSLKGRA